MKIYLASPFFSDEQVERVKKVEKALKDNPTVQDFFSPRLNQIDELEFGTKEWSKAVFKNDVDHIDWCDAVVAVHDFTGETNLHGSIHQHVDSGTAFEIGYAYATGKPVVMIHEKGGIVNLMLSESLKAYFTDAKEVADYDFTKMPSNEFTGEVL
ncbi:nucleoside 2-deoxyribosyltransferase [Priestia megaterium]|uniref:nucleoside 2-deoxyribosyltransferase n=1 Tax=Priestia megaterium TaxID=1404 RepID=UPI002E21BA5D|nr:nucleoside 2-deoxyribosyltransferase [Priestia megaterium]